MSGKTTAPLFRCALVALHHSRQDEYLLDYLAMLIRFQLISEVRFVHVIGESGSPGDQEVESQLLTEMKAKTSDHFVGLLSADSIKHAILRGALVDQLLKYTASEYFDLVVVGHRLDHALRRSLARQLTIMSPCSVLLVPEGSTPAIRRILAPVDFSPPSAHALSVALQLGAAAGLRSVSALHVYFDESRTTYEGADKAIRGNETEHFAAFVAGIDTAGVRVEPLFREGVHPAKTICEVASELSCDMTVLETRGRTSSAAILLGSVAEETLSESHGPVLVVKQQGTQIGLFRALLLKMFQRQPGLQTD